MQLLARPALNADTQSPFTPAQAIGSVSTRFAAAGHRIGLPPRPWTYPCHPNLAELLIDCEEDRTLRAVLVGMLRGCTASVLGAR